jgi:hypothetical protein
MIDTEVKTAIHLHAPADIDGLYDEAVNAILKYDNVNWTDVHKMDIPVREQPGVKMVIPVGANIKLMICYRPDGKPLSDEGDFLLRQAACNNPDCKPSQHFPAHHTLLAFATDIGHQTDGIQNCGELHASIIYRLGEWLDNHGIRWSWASVLNDDTHSGYDNLNKMSAWFGEYQQKLAYRAAMESLGPAVPLNSLPGLMIFAERVAAAKAEEDDSDDDWEDPYADYVEEDE